jgi:hypothetical protein
MPAFMAVLSDLGSLRISWSQPIVFTGLDQRCLKSLAGGTSPACVVFWSPSRNWKNSAGRWLRVHTKHPTDTHRVRVDEAYPARLYGGRA